MKLMLPKLFSAFNNHQIFLSRITKYITATSVTILISCLITQPAFAGRPSDKPRIYLGTFSAPATIPLTGILLPGTNAVGSVGDLVTIEAELFSSDPDEDREGEPLLVISQPSINSGTGKYYDRKRFAFKIAKQGQYLDTVIDGYDGDESAQLTGWVDPAPPKDQLSDEEKAQLAGAGERLELLAASEDVAAKTCVRLKAIPLYICEIFETFSVANSRLAESDKALALDPPDSNFTVIDQPIILNLPLITLGTGLTQAEVDSYNALLINQTKYIGVARAMLTSINRSVGAYDANNDLWEKKQREAAALYSLQLSSLAHEQTTLLANVQAAWQKGTIGSINITPSDVLNAEIELIYYGLPVTYVQKLQQLGVDSVTIETMKNRMRVQNTYEAAGTFPDILTNPLLINSLNKAADAFYESAINNAIPLTHEQTVEGEGDIRSSTGNAITSSNSSFEFEVKANDSGNLSSEFKLRVQSYAFNFVTTRGSVTRAALLGNTAILEGTYSASDATTGTFRIIATDSGKEGKGKSKDMVTISLSNGYQISGVLDRGHIKIKTDQNDD